MKTPLRIIGATMLALLALSAFAASAAWSEEGVLPNATSSGEGGTSTLETLSKEKLSCTTNSILALEFLKEKEKDNHAEGILHRTGCKVEGLFPVNSLGDASEVILLRVLIFICLATAAQLVFALFILETETDHLEVPSLGQLLLVKGAVIAELEGAGLKGKEFQFKLEGKAGDQTTALKCELEGKKLGHTLEAANDSASTDTMASESGKFTLKFSQEVELMDT